MSKTTHRKFLTKQQQQKIGFVAFLIAWTCLVMISSQYLLQFLMFVVLHLSSGNALNVLILYILNYSLDLALLILVTPKLIILYQKTRHLAPTSASRKLSQELSTNHVELGMKDWPTFVDIGLAPVGFIIYMILARIATLIVTSIFSMLNDHASQDVGFAYFSNSFAKICGMLALIVVAPIAEEIIMRGWLYGKLRGKLKYIPAMLITSVLFGFLHGQVYTGIVTFVLSLILCTMREITGTIWSGVLLHILVNAVAFYFNYVLVGL